MSVLQNPDAFDASDLQVWNNAAFDHGDCVNLTLSLESNVCGKENRCSDSPVRSFRSGQLNLNLNLPFEPASPMSNGIRWKDPPEAMVSAGRNIDSEIEEIEKEISRLSSRLEVLRLEKVEQKLKAMEPPGGRTVPAKFTEKKQGIRWSDDEKKFDGAPLSSTKAKVNRRGVSLGPAEISSAVKTRQSNKVEVTPMMSVQSRRKSCFWKLEEIDELKVAKERRKSISHTLSPKTRKTVSKTQPVKQAATTVGSKRIVKKDEGAISAIQPKRLFKEGEKSAKKPAKPGRVIASRYNQITISAARKRSFPENDKEETERFDKRRASQGSATAETEAKAKKRWEIPKEVVLQHKSEEDVPVLQENKRFANKSSAETPLSIVKINEQLPKIRISRELATETPRDSGPAKRASELVSRINYFGDSEENNTTGLAPLRQALTFNYEEA